MVQLYLFYHLRWCEFQWGWGHRPVVKGLNRAKGKDGVSAGLLFAHCYILMCNILMFYVKITKEASKAKNGPFAFTVLISQDMVLYL